MRLTFRYSIIQVFFWSIVAVIMNYASVFLLGKGFRNTEIGLMIAFASLISACLGPLIGAWSDHPKGPTVRTVLLASVAVFLLAMFLVIFF